MNKIMALLGLVMGVFFLPFFGVGIPMIMVSLKELMKDDQ